MNVLPLALGAFSTNCYLVWQDGVEALLVDCAGEADAVLSQADTAARAGYELRAAHSEPGLEPGDEQARITQVAGD